MTEIKHKNSFFCTKCFKGFDQSDTDEFIVHQEHKVIEVIARQTETSITWYLFCKTCDKPISPSEGDEHHDHDIVADPRSVDDIKKLVRDVNVKKESNRKKSASPLTPTTNDSEPEKCYQVLQEQMKGVVISAENSYDTYGIIENENHLEPLDLDSGRAIHWAKVLYRKQKKDIFSDEFYKKSLGMIISHAQMDTTTKAVIYNRVAQLSNVRQKDGTMIPDLIIYDLANQDFEAVKITANHVEIIKHDETTPFFRRGQTTHTQVTPQFNDPQALEKIVKLFNLLEGQEQIFTVTLITQFLAARAIPSAFFDGQAGSFKTSVSAMMKMIIDPSGKDFDSNAIGLSTDIDNLTLTLYNRYFTPFDNVTNISPEQADTLSKATTGSTTSKRKLYENKESIELTMRRKYSLGGVAPKMDYPDLVDRLLAFPRKNAKDVKTLEEEVVLREFNELLPNALGCIFTAISKAMEIRNTLTIEIKTRLADFERWGEAISQALGYQPNTFLESYYNKRNESAMSAKESFPIIDLIEALLNQTKPQPDCTVLVELPTDELLHKLELLASEHGVDIASKYVRFPKMPNQLSRMIKTVAPILQKMDVFVELYHYDSRDGKYKRNAAMVRIQRKMATILPT